MTIIDSHAHFEPQLLDLSGLVARMNDHGIDATALIAAVTLDPIYKKPDYPAPDDANASAMDSCQNR